MTRKVIDIVNTYSGSKIVTVEDGSDDEEASREWSDDVDTTAVEPTTSAIIPEEQGSPVEPGKTLIYRKKKP